MGVFFITWQLWEEMTFVLACAIVAVFGVGLFKLWRTSRQVRRQEVLDEEKRARLTEMRKVSLTAKKRKNRSADIPFGVRAIQTGVEVDGIWISRPTTPSSSRSKMSKMEAPKMAEGKRLLGDYQPYASSPLVDTLDPTDTHSNTSTPLPQISENPAALNEDALHRLEGTYSPTGFATANTLRPPFLNTYIPSSRMSSPSPSVNVANANANQRPHEATRSILGQPGPSTTSDSNSSTSSRQPQIQTQPASTAYTSYRGYQTQPVSHYSAPPSFSPSPTPVAGAIAGRTARRVNSSFEVLPAGTFAGREQTVNLDKNEESAEAAPQAAPQAAPPTRNKLRRSNGPIR